MAASQDSQLTKIDKLLKEAQKNHTKYRDFEELKLAKEANILAEKTNNSKLISESSYIVARALCSLELQKESLYYIQKASKQKFTKQTPILQAKLIELKSYNYYVLSLKSQSSAELHKILEMLKGNKDFSSVNIICRTHDNIANHYFDENKIDSALIFYRLSTKELEKLPVSKFHNVFCEHYINLGNAFLKKENADSTLYYFKKSYELKLKYKDPILFTQYMVFGSYYENQKQYEKALELYLKAIQNMKKYSVNEIPFNFINKKISDLYGILGNKNKQNEFAELYSKEENQLTLEKSRNVDYALNIILADKKNEYNSTQQKKYAWIFIGVSVLIIISLFIYTLLRNNLKHKESTISEFTNTLQQKEEIISKKNVETEELQQKVNDAYTEIIELAKNNNPSFYFRFQEVYPEFQKKLLEYNPNLRTSELILCAYTYLGFTIKDIAEYTFKSVNTIRNRKQNLRKKFAIQTEEDMGIWLRNLTREKS
ncbi:helix-turn-helix transcriptional regulator [Chryseobacterium sp. SIMBA_038]|uniref:helix-turn-helix transcriptional regulator n=1 Tax=Chryseobacterium sp. SIMBA_038 TaxID=3085780 RepID=UPI003979FF66